MTFAQPQWLVLLGGVAVLAAAYAFRQLATARYAVKFTNLALLDVVAPNRPGWRRHAVATTFLLASVVLVASLAQPVMTVTVPRRVATIVLAVDVSPSMQATDVEPSRLAAARRAATRFVDLLPETFDVGLVGFAGTAQVLVPPTTDRQTFADSVQSLDYRSETAIGEAVLVSLDSMGLLDRSRDDDEPPAQILLLSDGSQTAGRPLDQAVEAARHADVPVSTVAFGTQDGTVTLQGEQVNVPPDDETLREIADRTGGDFLTAASEQQLLDVYRQSTEDVLLTEQRRDVSRVFLGTGLALILLTALGSLRWFARLP